MTIIMWEGEGGGGGGADLGVVDPIKIIGYVDTL